MCVQRGWSDVGCTEQKSRADFGGHVDCYWQLEENCERDRSIPVIRSLPARCWPGSGGQRRLNIGNYYLLDTEGTGRTARPELQRASTTSGWFAAVQRPLIGSTPVRQFAVVYNSELGEVFFVNYCRVDVDLEPDDIRDTMAPKEQRKRRSEGSSRGA